MSQERHRNARSSWHTTNTGAAWFVRGSEVGAEEGRRVVQSVARTDNGSRRGKDLVACRVFLNRARSKRANRARVFVENVHSAWRLSHKKPQTEFPRFEFGVEATRRRPRGARRATARTPPRAACRLAACVFRRFVVSRTWQMSHMGLASALNATRSCLATTALAEWMLREPVG